MSGAQNRQEAVTAHFEAYAAKNRWGELYNPVSPLSYAFLARRRKVVELLPNLAGKRLLDVGCGTGALVEPLLRTEVEYEGIDIAPTMVAVAQGHIRDLGAQSAFRVRLGSGTSLPFPSSHFDAVVAMGLLEYFDDPEHVITEAVRVAKPGARLVFTIPQKYSLDDCVVRASAPLLWVARKLLQISAEPVERRKYTPREFQELFRRGGCRIVDDRYYNMRPLPYPVTRFFPRLANAGARLCEEHNSLGFLAIGYILACEK